MWWWKQVLRIWGSNGLLKIDYILIGVYKISFCFESFNEKKIPSSPKIIFIALNDILYSPWVEKLYNNVKSWLFCKA